MLEIQKISNRGSRLYVEEIYLFSSNLDDEEEVALGGNVIENVVKFLYLEDVFALKKQCKMLQLQEYDLGGKSFRNITSI